jgi:hypothetical protein
MKSLFKKKESQADKNETGSTPDMKTPRAANDKTLTNLMKGLGLNSKKQETDAADSAVNSLQKKESFLFGYVVVMYIYLF